MSNDVHVTFSPECDEPENTVDLQCSRFYVLRFNVPVNDFSFMSGLNVVGEHWRMEVITEKNMII